MFNGVLKECSVEEDRNGEYLAVSPDGEFLKFPKDCDLEMAIDAHNKVNEMKVEEIPDMVYGEVTIQT